MFSYLKERKAEAALAALVPGLAALIASVRPVQKAAALAVANAMLIAGTVQWGREFAHAPMRLSRETACDAICVLADHHAKLEMAVAALAGRPQTDPQISACKWEIAATQTVIATAGASFSRQYADAARSAWFALGSARRHSDEAVRAMLDYSRAYSVSPIPSANGKPVDATYLRSLASNLPPMFRPKAARRA